MENAQKSKVLYLVTKSNWGGAQRYVYDLATHIHDLGVGHLSEEVEVIVAARDSGLLAKKLLEKNIKFVTVSYFGIFELIRKEKPDVVHTNSSVYGGVGSFFAWLNRVPKIVFTAHGWPFNEDRNFLWKLIVYKLSWLTSMFSDIIITITKSDYEQGKRMPFVSHKMRLMHNAIEKIDFYDKDIAREKLGLDKSDLIVGSIGELHPNKGYTYLAQAAELIPEAKFVIIGEGELREKLATTRLNLVGFVPEASRYLRAFDIFVLPSLKEGLPYVLLEAAQAGLPIVASNVGGIPDIVGDKGILVPPKDPGALAKAIRQTIATLPTQIKYKQFLFEDFLSATYSLYK